MNVVLEYIPVVENVPIRCAVMVAGFGALGVGSDEWDRAYEEFGFVVVKNS